MPNPFQPFFDQQPFVVLDGALATELERHGADLKDDLWSAKVLVENPELIYQVHLDYLKAGADVITTASYQASFPGFRQKGIDQKQAEKLLQLSIDLARRAVDDFWQEPTHQKGRLKPLVAASIGPYGAFLADGSEYRGDYGVFAKVLDNFHRPRVEFLAKAGADVLAFETVPSAMEAEVLFHIMSGFDNLKYWISFSCKNSNCIVDGSRLSFVIKPFTTTSSVVAIGINCTAPQYITGLLKEAKAVTDKLLMIYPNSGEGWDAEHHCWVDIQGTLTLAQQATDWHQAGARIIGGCCRTSPEDIHELRQVMATMAP